MRTKLSCVALRLLLFPSPPIPGSGPGPHGSFTVRGANIQDPLGHRFVVRGAVIAPGAAHRARRARSMPSCSPACATTRACWRRWASTPSASTSRPSPTATSASQPSAMPSPPPAPRISWSSSRCAVAPRGGARVRRATSPSASTRTARSGCSPRSIRPATAQRPIATAASPGRPGAPSSARSCTRSAAPACTRRSCSRRRAARATCACSRTTT